MTGYIQVITTIEKRTDAEAIADQLINKRLAACVQISEPVQSRYHWQGKVESANEHILTIKSRRNLFDELCAVIEDLHPYEAPEILACRIEQGSKVYLEWLDNELKSAD